MRKDSHNPVLWLLVLVLILAYVGPYYVLSRRAFCLADQWGMMGFYFLPPENSDAWRRKNYGLVCFFYPLILLDNALSTGRPVACEPMWGMSS